MRDGVLEPWGRVWAAEEVRSWREPSRGLGVVPGALDPSKPSHMAPMPDPAAGEGLIPIRPSWPLWLAETSLLASQQPPPRPPCHTQKQASISPGRALGHGPHVGRPELRGATPSPERWPDITHQCFGSALSPHRPPYPGCTLLSCSLPPRGALPEQGQKEPAGCPPALGGSCACFPCPQGPRSCIHSEVSSGLGLLAAPLAVSWAWPPTFALCSLHALPAPSPEGGQCADMAGGPTLPSSLQSQQPF